VSAVGIKKRRRQRRDRKKYAMIQRLIRKLEIVCDSWFSTDVTLLTQSLGLAEGDARKNDVKQ